jgi:hypothetical protein
LLTRTSRDILAVAHSEFERENRMLASILIAGISTGLFYYWFRYSCVLILSTRTSKDYTSEVAGANQLRFLEVQVMLREALAPAEHDGRREMDRLQTSLESDYRVISMLLRHTQDLEVGDGSLEQQMLRFDFACMKVWYRISRRISESASRNALLEMSQIVAHFANAFGERAARQSAA